MNTMDLNRYNEAFNPATCSGRVYAFLSSSPAAAHEIQQALGLSRRHAASITSSLHCLGLIQPSGLRRLNPRGRLTIVWKATLPPPPPPLPTPPSPLTPHPSHV